MFMNAAPGQILSWPRASDDPGVFYCPSCLAPRGFRSILFWKASLNKGLFELHGAKSTNHNANKVKDSMAIFWEVCWATTDGHMETRIFSYNSNTFLTWGRYVTHGLSDHALPIKVEISGSLSIL